MVNEGERQACWKIGKKEKRIILFRTAICDICPSYSTKPEEEKIKKENILKSQSLFKIRKSTTMRFPHLYH
jgi:heat shock protein HspQ